MKPKPFIEILNVFHYMYYQYVTLQHDISLLQSFQPEVLHLCWR